MALQDELITIVRSFFQAFDDKDLEKIKELCIPSTQMIHHNGVVTNTEQMCTIIKNTKSWWPRNRKTWHFEVSSDGDLAVVGLKNQVTFSLPKKMVEELYRETWIFQKIDQEWKPVRIHYCLATEDEHSEDVA